MSDFKDNIELMNTEEMGALSNAVPTDNNMVTSIPTLVTDRMDKGLHLCCVGVESIISFKYNDNVDRDLLLASKELESRLPLKNYADTLKLIVPVPVGMRTTYNKHIDKLLATGPAVIRAKAAILELDATLAKAISEKDYRTAMVALDGNAKTRLKEVTELTNDLLIDMGGDESVGEVIEVFKDINGIPDLVKDFTEYKFDIDVDTLKEVSDVLSDRAAKFRDMIEYKEVSKDMLKSVNSIIVSTANIITMVAAVLANVRNTKKALTKAIVLIK